MGKRRGGSERKCACGRAAIGRASTPWERGVGHQRRESIRPCALKPAWRKRQGVALSARLRQRSMNIWTGRVSVAPLRVAIP